MKKEGASPDQTKEKMNNCWNIKEECPYRGTTPAEAKCPVYACQSSCWEFDWLGFYGSMPDGPEKDEWKRMMLEWCSSCEIRNFHSREVNSFLAKLERR